MEKYMSVGNRILIYEPDKALGNTLMPILSKADGQFIWRDNSADTFALLRSAKINVAIISASPDADDSEMIDKIYSAARNTPFLVATRADEIDERIHGLNEGAADYLIRPFDANELLARIATVLRRRETTHERFARRGSILLDNETPRLGDGSTWTALSPTEHKVFSLLFGCADRPVSKLRLKNMLADGEGVSDNAIEVGIYRLRIKARSWGMCIKSYRGLGYALEDA